MDSDRHRRTMDFVNRIARSIECVPRQNGYDLKKTKQYANRIRQIQHQGERQGPVPRVCI